MEHVLFVQRVKPEKRSEYIKEHQNAPRELLQMLRHSGIEREIIWMHKNNVFIYVMGENIQAAVDRQKKTEEFQNWLAKMEPLLDEMQDYSDDGKILGLEKVFDLEEQL